MPQVQDVIFEAAEELFSNSLLVLTKGSHKRIPLTRSRIAQSYIYEFCGMVGIAPSTLLFTLESRPLDPSSIILGPCIVKAHHNTSIIQSSQNSLQPALLDLYTTGLQSDALIYVNNRPFAVHKCILMCRSAKFRAMFTSSMREGGSSSIYLEETDEVLFEKLLHWIYSGTVTMPGEINGVCRLLVLADEYFLGDLKMRCEEDMISKLCPENLIEILVAAHRLPLMGEAVVEECMEMFVKEFQVVKETPELEKIIASVPGLMTRLFGRFHSASKKTRKRRVTFRINEDVVDTLDDVSLLYSGYSSTASSYT